MVTTTPFSDADKEIRTLRRWLKKLEIKIGNHPRITLIAIIILIVLASLSTYQWYKYSHKIDELRNDIEKEKELDLTFYFYFDKSLEDWKVGKTYPFELHLNSSESISTENSVYFKPVYGKSLKPPVAKNYADSDFSYKHSDTVKGFIDTSSTDEGWYNICAVIKDKADPARRKESCDRREIKIKS